MKYVALFGMLAVTACAPSLLSGNEVGGIVGVRGSLNGQSKAMTIADAHCRKFGKVAKSDGMNDIHATMRFSCVTP